ncbi:MAG TPA: OPT/YSL family transporter, partial [Lacunisphaera sp.]|nr:OPT/YSL family transporter [Lacunisphaera sp.]
AVGVYLPISSSLPIFIGGMMRWSVDRWMKRKPAYAGMSQETFNAECDKSPGVLLSSGYIAGGAIAGIVIAFLAGVPGVNRIDALVSDWAKAHNPFYVGPHADLLSLIPYALLCGFLYFVAKEKLLAPKR